jgi:hypothetical protein
VIKKGTIDIFGVTKKGTIDDPVIGDVTSLACTLRFDVPQEGLYIVSLTITALKGTKPVINTYLDNNVIVRDHLIVGMGDSLGSGEGNPDISAPDLFTEETWQSRRCHRSAKSGQALAAKQLEDIDTKSSVTFVHVACSGASIAKGLIGGYKGIEPPFGAADLLSQVDQVRAVIGDRRIDAILLNVGANDIGFGDIVLNCIVQFDCNRDIAGVFDLAIPDLFAVALISNGCGLANVFAPLCLSFAANVAILYSFVGTSAQIYADRLPGLSGQFDLLAQAIRVDLGVTDPSRVYLPGYLKPTNNGEGTPCDPVDYGADIFRTLFGVVNRAEFAWAGGTVVPGLNGALNDAANHHGWTFISGLPAAFDKGGYCAATNTRATRQFLESLEMQHDHNGMLHPNLRGHKLYRDRFMDHLRNRFAPVGNWTLSPNQRTVAAKEAVDYVLDWKHPTVWRDLTSMEVRFRSGDDIALWVRWDERANTFLLVKPKTGRLGRAHQAGSRPRLQTKFASLYLRGSTAKGSGPKGPSVAVTFDLSFKNKASGREWTVEVWATDDSGAIQEFEWAGIVTVAR